MVAGKCGAGMAGTAGKAGPGGELQFLASYMGPTHLAQVCHGLLGSYSY